MISPGGGRKVGGGGGGGGGGGVAGPSLRCPHQDGAGALKPGDPPLSSSLLPFKQLLFLLHMYDPL